MDEPLSNLDAQLRVEMRAELVELHRRLGITILYVTHDQIEAMTMGHRIAVLKDGVLQQLDTPGNVRDTPSNAFVASFVGSPPMNILRGTLSEAEGRLGAETVGGRVTLTAADAAVVRRMTLESVLVGIRPEDLRIARGRPLGHGQPRRVHGPDPTRDVPPARREVDRRAGTRGSTRRCRGQDRALGRRTRTPLRSDDREADHLTGSHRGSDRDLLPCPTPPCSRKMS